MNEMDRLVKILIDKKKTIASMESCTGGEFASMVTNVEGASEVMKFSAVTYCDEYKIKMGVDREIIDKYSVYSMEVAKCMSKRISEYSDSDYGVGITGEINSGNNLVFVSIYDRDSDRCYGLSVEMVNGKRIDNKIMIVNNIVKVMLGIV